jgi:ATP-dependent DNA helicase DinG
VSNSPSEALKPPVEGPSSYFFTHDAAQEAAREIADAGGVEVFFIGRRDQTGLIIEIEAHAYGTEETVPALLQVAKPGEVFIHNHPDGYLMPSNADLNVASSLGNMGVGAYIIDNTCAQCRVIVRPSDPKKCEPLDEREVLSGLSAQSGLAQVIEDFEDRPQQREMAQAVTQSLNHDGITVVEAGTGTGKSFAYLIPAILYALKNDERIVVSTNTINLQEQLLNKDIPALRRALNQEFSVELVKGRNNYLCKRKAEYATLEADSLLEDEFLTELKEIVAWSKESPNGDRHELTTTPRPEVWDRVKSEADNCLRVRCPFYENCFYYNSRHRAARAKLLIVNHSLLMSDIQVRRLSNNYSSAAVLPPYKRIIIDEAHHLEEVATRNLAQQITRLGLRQLFSRLYRSDKRGAHGVLASLADEMNNAVKAGLIPADHKVVHRLLFELMPRVTDVRDSMDFLFEDFCAQYMRAAGINSLRPGEEQKIRITWKILRHPLWSEECEPLLAGMMTELAKFIEENRSLLKFFDEELDEKAVHALTNPMLEWQAYVGRIDGLKRTISLILNDDPNTCKWVELYQRPTGKRDLLARLCAAPLDVRDILRQSLHDRMKSEVLTSATLTVDRSFHYFHDRTGLPTIKATPQDYAPQGEQGEQGNSFQARPISQLLLATPFDYRQQVYFGVPTDLPDPRDNNYTERFADLVNRAIAVSGGRAFVLFTSYGQLRRVADLCEPTIRRLGIDLLRQGEMGRDALLNRFREDETSVLFATSSFWEGVDVRGRALELLIIARLPFSVPSEPIQEAQFEAMKAEGRDPFDNLVVPRAVIRFKQGFGRLIRSRTDKGAVLIADKRVVQMGYGRRFLYSLPDLNVRQTDTQQMMGEMHHFLSQR